MFRLITCCVYPNTLTLWLRDSAGGKLLADGIEDDSCAAVQRHLQLGRHCIVGGFTAAVL
jgi:hypothetical protein